MRTPEPGTRGRGVHALALVNSAIWALAMIVLVFVVQRAPSARGLYVVLAGGISVSVALLVTIRKSR